MGRGHVPGVFTDHSRPVAGRAPTDGRGLGVGVRAHAASAADLEALCATIRADEDALESLWTFMRNQFDGLTLRDGNARVLGLDRVAVLRLLSVLCADMTAEEWQELVDATEGLGGWDDPGLPKKTAQTNAPPPPPATPNPGAGMVVDLPGAPAASSAVPNQGGGDPWGPASWAGMVVNLRAATDDETDEVVRQRSLYWLAEWLASYHVLRTDDDPALSPLKRRDPSSSRRTAVVLPDDLAYEVFKERGDRSVFVRLLRHAGYLGLHDLVGYLLSYLARRIDETPTPEALVDLLGIESTPPPEDPTRFDRLVAEILADDAYLQAWEASLPHPGIDLHACLPRR